MILNKAEVQNDVFLKISEKLAAYENKCLLSFTTILKILKQ